MIKELVTGRLNPALSSLLSVSMFSDEPARPFFAGRKSEQHSALLFLAAFVYDPDRVGACEGCAIR